MAGVTRSVLEQLIRSKERLEERLARRRLRGAPPGQGCGVVHQRQRGIAAEVNMQTFTVWVVSAAWAGDPTRALRFSC
jgi:hypothetical protein